MPSCQSEPPSSPIPATGIPFDLAKQRAKQISQLHYALRFNIPAKLDQPVNGSLKIDLHLSTVSFPLIFDFRAKAEQVETLRSNGQAVDYQFENEHIIIAPQFLKKGANNIEIVFRAGDLSLNRSKDYLYTLFVPDRASSAFPCFDQPNLKAGYELELLVPADWSAVANGPLVSESEHGDQKIYRFADNHTFSSYLFAFAAGRFQHISFENDNRKMTMYYRETDQEKVAQNATDIFDLHLSSIAWLEEYTGIRLPFNKFDFVLIPGFQYGGMEHVGCIFYKEPSLLLDATATQNQKLGRARLIAHETAHMWFGNLVTMDWFNDVWLKEVFANFMAAKIVNPGFPDINHRLSFLFSHQPSAYSEDRSGGSHPIQQELENLKDAGTLYGRIIYQKAPVVMQQLETMMGEAAFRKGLREYLKNFSYGNATWDNLIAILGQNTSLDLASWSEVWVKESGMPVLHQDLLIENEKVRSLKIIQEERSESGLFWPQQIELVLFNPDSLEIVPISISEKETIAEMLTGRPVPKAILLNGSEMGYGYFKLDEKSREYLLKNLAKVSDPLVRGAGWLALYEELLHHRIPPSTLMQAIMTALPTEEEPLNRQNLLNNAQTLYWRFFPSNERLRLAPKLEDLLWSLALQTEDIGGKSAFFRAYRSITLSEKGVQNLYDLWQGARSIPGLPLPENDRIDLACKLALIMPDSADSILQQQLKDIKNPDRKQRLVFIQPSLSPEQATRDQFFESLKNANNRHYEPWVADVLEYLHHPLRAESAEKYLLPSLELMEEIQATGDIFFPRRWITATLSGHQSPSAAEIVFQFLADRPDYPYRLRNKILMGGDLLFRVSGKSLSGPGQI